MGRRNLTAVSALVLAFGLAACGEDSGSGGSEETEPSFEDAQAIAEEQLAGEQCEFQVDDQSTDGLEQKSLDCLRTVGGEQQLTTVFTYERDEEADSFGGITTADRYFQNGNITVEPAGGDPTAPQLDADAFSNAVKESCGCGEVLTPES